jgi:hypothetical protein
MLCPFGFYSHIYCFLPRRQQAPHSGAEPQSNGFASIKNYLASGGMLRLVAGLSINNSVDRAIRVI